jgi:hypothetical protein
MSEPRNTYSWTSDGMEPAPYANVKSEWVKAEDYDVLVKRLDQRESELRWACETLNQLSNCWTQPVGDKVKTILTMLEDRL